MKKLLITGFDPFGGESINPSWESVFRLNDVIGEYSLTKLQIPTVFSKAAESVIQKAEELQPDVVLCIGQAGGRAAVTPEVVAINLREATIPDNAGNQPTNERIAIDGENAYFSNIPVREIVTALKANNIPSALSFSAGAFVCNDVLYSLLHHFKDTKVRVGFIHLPFLPEQAKGKYPSLPLETLVTALEIVIQTL